MQSIFFAEIDFQPVVHIFDADTGTVLGTPLHNGLNLFLAHADAVILLSLIHI